VSFYTKKGDDGTTGLYYGGRRGKDDPAIEACGAVDEAQACLGLVRAEVAEGSEVDQLLIGVERDLYVLMGELATAPDNRHKLEAGKSLVTELMVERIARATDDIATRFEMPNEFVIPGQNRVSALLDVARTVVRRAERRAIGVAPADSSVIPYLNRLSSLLWAMARWQEGGHSLTSKDQR
jgi:cob(I)alamin adenosyltransferase